MPDELHLMLQVTNILTQNLIKQAAIAFGWEATDLKRASYEILNPHNGNKCPHSHQKLWCDF